MPEAIEYIVGKDFRDHPRYKQAITADEKREFLSEAFSKLGENIKKCFPQIQISELHVGAISIIVQFVGASDVLTEIEIMFGCTLEYVRKRPHYQDERDDPSMSWLLPI